MWDEIRKMKPIERRPDGELFRLTPKQARRVWRLVKLCCNNVDGDCLLLDDGEGCACPQSIAYTLICKYFRRAVLPSEPELEEDIFNPKDMRRCKICGTRLWPVLDEPNTVPNVPPKYIVNRRQPTPEKRGRA